MNVSIKFEEREMGDTTHHSENLPDSYRTLPNNVHLGGVWILLFSDEWKLDQLLFWDELDEFEKFNFAEER